MNYLSCSTIREVIVLCCVCTHQSWVQAPSLVLQSQALLDVLQHFFHHLQKFCLSTEVKHIEMLQAPQHRHIYIILLKMKLWQCSVECCAVESGIFVIYMSKYLNNRTRYNYIISLRINCTF